MQSDVPIPSSYSLSLNARDGLEDMDHVEIMAMVQEETNLHVVTLDVGPLPLQRVWDYEIFAFKCQENRILKGELSEFEPNTYFLSL